VNDSTRVVRRPRRAWPPTAYPAAATIATAALALLAAACSGSPSSTGGASNAVGSTSSSSVVGFSRCMRSHGVPNFPDPGSSGQINIKTSGVDPNTSQYEAAQGACQHLLPTTGSLQQQTDQCMQSHVCPPALVQQILTVERTYARCMRSHGFPNWPDPTIGSRGTPVFDLSKAGIDRAITATSQFASKARECGGLPGGTVPVVPYE
jgi:hypothetical protein